MAPAVIRQGAAGAPDSVQVLMSSNSGFALPMRVRENHRRDGSTFVLEERTNVGNRQGDLLLVVPPPGLPGSASPSPTGQVAPHWCSVVNVSSAPAGDMLEHGTGANGPWNQDATATVFPGTLSGDISYAAGSYLVNLGNLIDRCYYVAGSAQRCGRSAGDTSGETPNTLRLRTLRTADASITDEETFGDIINLQAVYGIDDDPRDNVVNRWDATAPADTARIIAVRLAVLARSSQYSKEAVTDDVPNWRPDGTAAENFVLPACPSGEPDCWRHYRYRVFEAVIPLRNMLWQARQS
jgi:type IV pilus assembly protein PilW